MFIEIFAVFVLLVFTLLLFWYLLDALFCKEDYVTNKYTTEKVAKFINENHFENKKFYDLGSSRGGFVLNIIEKCPQLQITGIDNSLLRIWISKFRAFVSGKKVKFFKKDIFKTDISEANLIYVYIPRVLLPKLSEKLEKELNPETIVITSRISFLNWQPYKIIPKNSGNENEQDIFIYKSPSR